MAGSRVFRGLAVAHLIAGVAYLSWRLTAGWLGTELSSVFLAAELYSFAAAVSFCLSHYRKPQARTYPTRLALADWPSVTICIMRRWDSVAATVQSARSALEIDYPWHRLFVVIVDVEADPAMQEAAQGIPCEYLACPSPTTDPLAYACEQVNTDFVGWIQAGHLVSSNYAQAMLPYFFDFPDRAPILNRTGFVQPTLRTLGSRHPDHPLQQLIPLGSFDGDIAPFLGSGALFRRAALAGIPSIDWRRPVRLGSRIHAQGWTSHHCSETEVQGTLLPIRNRRVALLSVLDALMRGLGRRGSGLPKLSQTQGFAYLWLTLWSLSGLPTLVYLGIPLWYLTTGQAPVTDFAGLFLAWFLPYFILGRLAWLAAYAQMGWRRAWQSERHTGSQFFQSILALIQVLSGRQPHIDKTSQWTLGSQALLIFLTLGVVSYRLGTLRDLDDLGIPRLGFVMAMIWIIYDLALLTVQPLDWRWRKG